MSQQALKLAHDEAWDAHEKKKTETGQRTESRRSRSRNDRERPRGKARSMDELKAEIISHVDSELERLLGQGAKPRLQQLHDASRSREKRLNDFEKFVDELDDRITMLEDLRMKESGPPVRFATRCQHPKT